MKKPTITEIIRGQSLSGDAGCTNGNYDIPVCVRFSDGTSMRDYTCRCNSGCNGSFRVNWLEIGDSVEKALKLNPWTFVEKNTRKEEEDFLNGLW